MSRRWGSIQVRKNRDGTESVRIRYDDIQPDGTRVQRSETLPHLPGQPAPTYGDAEALLVKRYHEIHTGSYIAPSDETISDFLTRWLELTADHREDSTYANYQSSIKNRIAPFIGALPMQRLSSTLVLQWVGQLRELGYKDSSIRNAYAVLAAAMADAVRWRLISRSPCHRESIKLRFAQSAEVDVWTVPEITAFIEAARRHDLGNIFLFVLETAVRSGEARALRWKEIDLGEGVVLINRTVSKNRQSQTIIKTGTKSGRSRRILLGPNSVALLTKTRVYQQARFRDLGIPWTPECLVFDRGDGEYLRATEFSVALQDICSAAGVRALTPHQLRHTGATLMLALGVPARIAEERLGHRTSSMTRRYQHPSLEMQRTAVQSLTTALGGAETDAS